MEHRLDEAYRQLPIVEIWKKAVELGYGEYQLHPERVCRKCGAIEYTHMFYDDDEFTTVNECKKCFIIKPIERKEKGALNKQGRI